MPSRLPSFEELMRNIISYMEYAAWVENSLQVLEDYDHSARLAFDCIEASFRSMLAKEEEQGWEDLLWQFDDEFPVWMVRAYTTLGTLLPKHSRGESNCQGRRF